MKRAGLFGEQSPNWKGGWKNKLPNCKICGIKLSKKEASFCTKHRPSKIIKHGNDNPSWKGDDVKYVALHQWVARNLGKPNKCENCGTTTAKRYEWANLTREYIRDLSKWTRLCSSCHVKHDRYKHQLVIEKI